MISDNQFSIIKRWMITECGLTGHDLLIYALIYGFTKGSRKAYYGTTETIAQWVGCGTRTANRAISKLKADKLITTKRVRLKHTGAIGTAYEADLARVLKYDFEVFATSNLQQIERLKQPQTTSQAAKMAEIAKMAETASATKCANLAECKNGDSANLAECIYKETTDCLITTEVNNARARTHERNVNTSDSLSLAADVELPSLGEGVTDLVASETETQPNVSKQNKTTPKRAKKAPLTREQVQRACDSVNIHESVLESVLGFVSHRREKNKPLTPRALTLLLNKLVKISSDPQVQVEVLEEAIFRGWDGVYPPKPQWPQTQHRQYPTPRRQEQELEPPDPSQLDMEVFRQYGISNWTLFHVQKFVRKDETLADAECKCATCLKDNR